ncbi:MAG TPA: methylmalonyl-CoA mutase family protein [Bryobacteraceae bacterium]
MSTPLDLASDFPPVPTSDWEAAIHADLAGADYQKKLVWRSPENIAVRPYYRRQDLPASVPPAHDSGKDWEIAEPGSEPPLAIRADHFHDSGATAVQELAFALAAGVDRLAAGDRDVSFVFAVGSNYFFEIAKLRAARVLWAQAAQAFDAPANLHLVVRTAVANKSLYDPYTNLLRVTTEALSAVLGGCDALIVEPFEFSPRLATNLQLLLKHEAHLNEVVDPAAGSYYIEWLTDALARDAWKLFQGVEAKGGYAQAQSFIDDAIDAARKTVETAVSSRRQTLVGVNNFPDLQETNVSPDVAVRFDWRMAEPFERIRLRTERHAHATGHAPVVLLLTRGDVKMRIARATFCANFFGCGGFAIRESAELEPADLIVLCSSDPEYLALAQEIIPRVKVPVIVAGNPKDQIQALATAGVAGFVHVFSNIVDTLTEWQNRLGVIA